MFSNLLKFEWLFINRKKAFYGMLVFYLLLGILTGVAANFPFPGTFKNGTYILNFIIGITSLLCIFSTTLSAAQTLFREKDAHFEAILYATPLRKLPYVLSRFSIIFSVSLLGYFLFVCGLLTGHLLQAGNNEAFGAFRLINYLHPFWVLLLPNIFFCTAVACAIGLLTNNKMLVYVAGVFIYFLYWGVSFYTNSPLIANSMPVSAEALSRAALIDPFGLAAFLEQTRYWTAGQRNNQLLQLSGNLLANRLVYLCISAGLLFVAYRKFVFASRPGKKKTKKRIETDAGVSVGYKPVTTRVATFSYDRKCLWSLLSTECLNIVRNVPVWVVSTGWIGFMSIEIFSDISGNTRLPEKFATTGVMVENIVSGLPLVALMVLLFYGNEIFWRSRDTRFDVLENASAVNPFILLFSKWLSLIFLVLLLLIISILTGIAIQLIKNYPIIDWKVYASLFYLIALPLSLNAGLIICLQALVNNKYMGVAVTGIIIFLTNTSAGRIAGIHHPLLQFANVFKGEYSEMNGFGRDWIAFDYKMAYWLGITVAIFIGVVKFRSRKSLSRAKLFTAGNMVLLAALGVSAITGIIIFNQTNIRGREVVNRWKQDYEKTYAFLKNRPQPTIAAVHTTIDLYPSEERYNVKGVYSLVNKTSSPIDTLFMYGDPEMTWGKWTPDSGQIIRSDPRFGYYTFKLEKPLQPGAATGIQFEFEFRGSPFNAAASFNTIIKNGSFIRISRYFPTPGYNEENELNDPQERRKRNMAPAGILPSLEDTASDDRNFINFDAVISTDAPQTAIAVGELKRQWKDGNRNYFHYASPSPLPFRFAVASATYACKKIKQRNTTIEVYYHPMHYQNIGHIVQTAVQGLDYFEANFGAYPFRAARFIEIASFTRGFAGTAYPGSLFVNESFGYRNKINTNPERDILNEMVSHELSHTWWGTSTISPGYREGNLLMTETLAMYSELMVYKKTYGEGPLLSRVNVHKNIYLSSRSSADEEPLYRLHPDKPYLAYDKGMVVMYQLYRLLGEKRLNTALKNFYDKFSYPRPVPVATDLLNELYAVCPPADSARISELFTEIITYDILVDKAVTKKEANGAYALEINATVNKYREDGKGRSVQLPFNETVAVEVEFGDAVAERILINAKGNKINTVSLFRHQPVNVIIDPDGNLLNRAEETKRKKTVNN